MDWGSPALALTPPQQQRGMQPRTGFGILMGYTPSGKSYCVLLFDGMEVVERRDLVFNETAPPSSGKAIHWKANDAAGDDGTATDAGIPGISPNTPSLTPSFSSGRGGLGTSDLRRTGSH